MNRAGESAFEAHEVDGSILDRIRVVAARQGAAPALGDPSGEVWTYAQLVADIDRIAAHLGERGVVPGAAVATVLEHSARSFVYELGALAAGAAVVPLDPDESGTAVATVRRRAGAEVALVEPARASGEPGEVVPAELGEARGSDRPRLDGDSVAFLHNTSGSTGRPKLAAVTHRGLLVGGRDLAAGGVLGPDTRIVVPTPLSFAAASCQILWALSAGAEVIVLPLRRLGLPALAEVLRERSATAVTGVPTLMRALSGLVGDSPFEALSVAVVGGEPIVSDDIAMLRSMTAQDLTIVPVYASSEMMLMSWSRIGPEVDAVTANPALAGTPVAGFDLDLDPLDDRDPGIGEIVVRAPMVSRGYWNDDAQTAERFDFDASGVAVTCRTGDVGIRTAAGIELAGRLDDVVKIRGNRVDLHEVESALRAIDGVATAAVVATAGRNRSLELVAHVVPAPSESLSPAGLRMQLAASLPAHAVPGRVVLHDELPTLAIGKVDRAALRAWDAVRGPVDAPGGDPPGGDVAACEAAIVDRVRSLLDDPTISANDDFFDLGGDSLLAVEVLLFIEEEFGVDLPMSSWIGLHSLRELAELTDRAGAAGEHGAVVVQSGLPSRSPLFVAYDLHGTAFRLRDLAHALGEDLPVYGFDSPFLSGERDVPRSLVELAKWHADQVCDVQPDGRLHLLGYSFGGLLTYEIARQLQAAGRELAFVGILDFGPVHVRHRPGRHERPRPPGGWAERAPSDRSLPRRMAFHAGRLLRTPAGRRLEAASRVVDVGREFDLVRARRDLARLGRVRPALRAAYAWYRHMELALAYRPRHADLDLVVFRSDTTAKGHMAVSRRLDFPSASEPTLGWGVLARSVEVVPVVGHHNDLVEPPYVDGVGAVVRKVLDAAVVRADG